MKRFCLILCVIMLHTFMQAQVTIQMEHDGGVYKVPCTVNGVKMKFIFDTGASSVCMSKTMAQFLLDGDYISQDDIKGAGLSVVADGSIVNHAILVLRDIELGGLHLRDVDATILESQNAPLLLGQSAISELGRITIDGDKLIIHNADNELTDEQLNQLVTQALKYIDSKSYLAAAECLERVDAAIGLTSHGLETLCFCYTMSGQDEKCIQSYIRWINEYGEEDSNDKSSVYYYLASSYYYTNKDEKALLWFQKQMPLLKDEEQIMENKHHQAWCYKALGRYRDAQRLHDEFVTYKIKQECQRRGCTSKEYQKLAVAGKIKDETMGYYYYEGAMILYGLEDYKRGDVIMECAGMMGYVRARNFYDQNIRPYKSDYETSHLNW